MIVLKRITHGVADHFGLRFSEWLMVYPCFAMGTALWLQDRMFQTSPSFRELARWATEGEWAFVVLICAVIRLLALTVNGTFDRFPYSPHIRIGAAFLSAGFWFQFTFGFYLAAMNGTGAWSAVVAYSTFVLAEGMNIYRASRDLGHIKARR